MKENNESKLPWIFSLNVPYIYAHEKDNPITKLYKPSLAHREAIYGCLVETLDPIIKDI